MQVWFIRFIFPGFVYQVYFSRFGLSCLDLGLYFNVWFRFIFKIWSIGLYSRFVIDFYSRFGLSGLYFKVWFIRFTFKIWFIRFIFKVWFIRFIFKVWFVRFTFKIWFIRFLFKVWFRFRFQYFGLSFYSRFSLSGLGLKVWFKLFKVCFRVCLCFLPEIY